MAGFSVLRARSFVFRLPLFTRVVAVVIMAAWLAGLQSAWDIRAWAALKPSEISLKTLYRTNTFVFVHKGLFHALMNVVALTPLMERFESEYGTLSSVALFIGPFSTIPALLYVFIERGIFRVDNAVMGASIWVFLLLGMEAIRTYRTNPHLVIATHHVPTWTTPLALCLVISALVPNTSLLGHLCGLGVGYLGGLGYLKFLSPPERVLRFVEGKLNLLGRLPHYVSVDQKTYGRFGVLPSSGPSPGSGPTIGLVGSTQRLGP
ncbi:rhomboid protein 2 [Magnaporthiopsis poae ATCC 64411]|uniref:rhomboid protease n=1 Tax=Magnaporthiopsis poae (strain ATCC 64411 / 73-15) TaxID=644358 RepID=A0A0C4EFH0_MAGP6|nr:rhomboid protein 2 [Magnaporthiopsis poae ATCC 64411]